MPNSRKYFGDIVRAFESETDTSGTGPKAVLANAIRFLAKPDDIDEIIRLSKVNKHGESRANLMFFLAKSKDPKSIACLRSLEGDPTQGSFAKELLDALDGKRSPWFGDVRI